jgi:hypothetical protein
MQLTYCSSSVSLSSELLFPLLRVAGRLGLEVPLSLGSVGHSGVLPASFQVGADGVGLAPSLVCAGGNVPGSFSVSAGEIIYSSSSVGTSRIVRTSSQVGTGGIVPVALSVSTAPFVVYAASSTVQAVSLSMATCGIVPASLLLGVLVRSSDPSSAWSLKSPPTLFTSVPIQFPWLMVWPVGTLCSYQPMDVEWASHGQQGVLMMRWYIVDWRDCRPRW